MKVCHHEGLVGTGSTLVRVAGAGGEVLKGTHAGLHFCWAPDFEVQSATVEPGSMRLRGVVRGKTVEILYAGIAQTKVGTTGPVVRGLERSGGGAARVGERTREAACPYLTCGLAGGQVGTTGPVVRGLEGSGGGAAGEGMRSLEAACPCQVVRGLAAGYLALARKGIELLVVLATFPVFPMDCGASVVTWAGQVAIPSSGDLSAFQRVRAAGGGSILRKSESVRFYGGSNR